MRVLIASLLIQHMTPGQDLFIFTAMTLCRGHEADTTVAVLIVVPADKVAHPTAGCVQICKAIRRPLRTVFQGSKQ